MTITVVKCPVHVRVLETMMLGNKMPGTKCGNGLQHTVTKMYSKP